MKTRKIILIISLLLCLLTLTSCKKIESYSDMKILTYEKILTRSKFSPTGSYYVIIHKTDCAVCQAVMPYAVEYANLASGNSKLDPIYSLNRSDKKNNDGITAEPGTQVNSGLGATDYNDIKLCSTPVLIKVTNGKVVKLIDKKTPIIAELNSLIALGK